MRAWAVVALALAACSADIPEGVYVCTTDADCPPGFSCGPDDRCYEGPGMDSGTPPVDAGTDATAPDAPEVDAPTGCDPDGFEPNEDSSAATDRGSVAVGEGVSWNDAWIHEDTDVDWGAVDVVADHLAIGDTMHVSVSLQDVPADADYDLEAYFACAGLRGSVSCMEGVPGSDAFDGGCASRTRSSEDEAVQLEVDCGAVRPQGTLYVRVSAFSWVPVCTQYQVLVEARR